jgi:hypothetical protein
LGSKKLPIEAVKKIIIKGIKKNFLREKIIRR